MRECRVIPPEVDRHFPLKPRLLRLWLAVFLGLGGACLSAACMNSIAVLTTVTWWVTIPVSGVLVFSGLFWSVLEWMRLSRAALLGIDIKTDRIVIREANGLHREFPFARIQRVEMDEAPGPMRLVIGAEDRDLEWVDIDPETLADPSGFRSCFSPAKREE